MYPLCITSDDARIENALKTAEERLLFLYRGGQLERTGDSVVELFAAGGVPVEDTRKMLRNFPRAFRVLEHEAIHVYSDLHSGMPRHHVERHAYSRSIREYTRDVSAWKEIRKQIPHEFAFVAQAFDGHQYPKAKAFQWVMNHGRRAARAALCAGAKKALDELWVLGSFGVPEAEEAQAALTAYVRGGPPCADVVTAIAYVKAQSQ